mmetsp:Transcript_12609/g.22464  ORF Transcript_12609/g.22464 Transcript_12609/m.22464 type:complete len:282 (-) Transcript_12609:115-960(-)
MDMETVAKVLAPGFPVELIRKGYTKYGRRVWAIVLVTLLVLNKMKGDRALRVGKGGKVVSVLPMLVYDLVSRMLWPLNYVINMATYFQPSCPNWASEPSLSPAKIAASKEALSEEHLARLRERILADEDAMLDERQVVQLFDTLEPATEDDMVGFTWRGRVIRTGSVLDLADWCLVRPLQLLGFRWGKRYRTRFVGDPLLVSWMGKFVFPLPAWGNVEIQEIKYRDKVQATMRYNHQPWNDYFRVLDDGSQSGERVMLGVWCAREKNGGWFMLREDASTPA